MSLCGILFKVTEVCSLAIYTSNLLPLIQNDILYPTEQNYFVLEITSVLIFFFYFRYGDMRVTMGCEIFSMWQNLGK